MAAQRDGEGLWANLRERTGNAFQNVQHLTREVFPPSRAENEELEAGRSGEDDSAPADKRDANWNRRAGDGRSRIAIGPKLRLPDEVEKDYEWVRDLPLNGREAYVSLVRQRETEDLRFLKHYNPNCRLDETVLGLVRDRASTDHVVKVYDFSSGEDAWEVQEYCRLGTLHAGDWIEANRESLEDRVIKDILRQLSEAIHHIHHLGADGKGFVHRDIKPSNILVRHGGSSPKVVLTDFGISRNYKQDEHVSFVAGTQLYQGPETYEGRFPHETDWFSLGAVVFELLIGAPLLEGSENPKDICLSCRYYDRVEQLVADKRWLMLIQGLVCADFKERWGYKEVSQWLKGDSPRVHWGNARSRFLVPWTEEYVYSFAELARSVASHWDDARDVLAGRRRAEVVRYIKESGEADSVARMLDGADSLDRKLLKMQLMLDPETVPVFRDWYLDAPSVRQRRTDAWDGDENSLEWLMGVLREDALVLFGGLSGDERAARAGLLLRKWFDQAEEVKKTVPEEKHGIVDDAFKKSLPELFSLAYK